MLKIHIKYNLGWWCRCKCKTNPMTKTIAVLKREQEHRVKDLQDGELIMLEKDVVNYMAAKVQVHHLQR